MIIERGNLKKQAKERISGQIFPIFVVLLVFGLIAQIFALISNGYSLFYTIPRDFHIFMEEGDLPSLGMTYVVGTVIDSLLANLSMIWAVLLFPLTISLAHFAMRIARGEKPQPGASINRIFQETFQNYGSYFGTVFLTNLIVGLWTMLLIVPGIIKRLEYSMVAYVKVDNPRLTSEQCRRLSSRLTYGHKLDIFILDLSFLGWGILNIVTFGLVSIYYAPYRRVTYALLYDFLKEDALKTGKVREEEFHSGHVGFAVPGYAYPAYPQMYMPSTQNTPQMLKQAVINAHPGRPVLRSGVPSLGWQEALPLIEECRKNGFLILGVDAYYPNGAFAPEHSLRAPLGNTWDPARLFIWQKAQGYELYYEIIF